MDSQLGAKQGASGSDAPGRKLGSLAQGVICRCEVWWRDGRRGQEDSWKQVFNVLDNQ